MFTFTKKFFPGLSNLGTQIRCAQDQCNTVQTDLKYPLLPLYNDPEMLYAAYDKSNYLLKSCLRTLILMTQIPLYLFPFQNESRMNLKLQDILATPMLVKKVITNLDSSKVPSSDCIQVVVLKNCEPKLSNKYTS